LRRHEAAMTYQTIFAASSFLLIAFAIEQVCRQRGIPSVIVLVLSGLLARPVLNYYGFEPDGINTLIPIVGAVGLVLIVLEGALDIDLRRDHLRVLATTSTTAILSITLCILLIYPFAVTLLSLTFVHALLLATPFAVISSAVAISGSSVLNKDDQEFVVYESSISDILGVLLFFALLGSNGTFSGILLSLVGGGLISILLSIISAVVLVLLLLRTDSHIRFTPLLAGLFALYALGELLHFSPLIMVLMLGLLLNKPTVITRFKVFRHWVPADYSLTLSEFRTLVLELTFVVRGFFFVLLGYWTDPAGLPLYQGLARRHHRPGDHLRSARRATAADRREGTHQGAAVVRPARTHHGAVVHLRQGDLRPAAVPDRVGDADRADQFVPDDAVEEVCAGGNSGTEGRCSNSKHIMINRSSPERAPINHTGLMTVQM
jgi:cell volume regulation protein A